MLLYRPALASSFDRAYAASLGYRAGLVDAALLALVAATVVVAILAVGNVLALALLIAPAATARLVANRLAPMMVIAGCLGALCGVGGARALVLVRARRRLDVVLCSAGAFLLVFAFTELRNALQANASEEPAGLLTGPLASARPGYLV